LWLEKWQFLSDICGNFTFGSFLIAVESMTLRNCAQNTRLITNVLHYIPTQQYTEPQEECPAAQQCQRKTLLSAVQQSVQEHFHHLCKC
jgi:hypothetical protein